MTKQILFLISTIFVSASLCAAQKNIESPLVVIADSNACEINSAVVDVISNEVRSKEERIFVIFRSGKSETETVNGNRLAHVKWFLENRKGWKSFDVIYARGEKFDGEGKIDFYIGGKLFLIMMSAKNRTPCLDCCDGGLEYPQSLVKKKSVTKRKS